MTKCPRCFRRTVRLGYDQYGHYALCIGCGWTDNGIDGLGLRRRR